MKPPKDTSLSHCQYRPQYRPCVGIVLFNPVGQVWLGKRYGTEGDYSWQFPQGGIDRGETAIEAAQREAYEETGINIKTLTLLAQTQDWLTYDYPLAYRGTHTYEQDWHGQKQKWFAYRHQGTDTDFNLTRHTPQEFSEWRWADLSETVELIIPFKRHIYQRLIDEFKSFSKPLS